MVCGGTSRVGIGLGHQAGTPPLEKKQRDVRVCTPGDTVVGKVIYKAPLYAKSNNNDNTQARH